MNAEERFYNIEIKEIMAKYSAHCMGRKKCGKKEKK